jgi:uncharacterized protein (DUF1778 family)
MSDGAEGTFMEHPVRKDDTIQIRTTAKTKAVLNRAAELRGQKLSEFMLESARRQAEEALLDQRAFFLEPEVYQKFMAMLDAPAKPSVRLKALMKRKASWET